MAEDSVQVEVEGDPEAVWAVVRDFGAIDRWFPGIQSCRVEGDVRILDMGGMEVREQLVELDEAGRALTYSVIDGVPVGSHKATVAVAPSGSGSTVTWSFAVEPAEMLPVFQDAYSKALAALGTHVG